MSYKLISVESRKGGVGKTTAALNLAYLLKDAYHVLLLDVDVTGTSIAAVEHSKFWKKDVNLIKRKGEPVNILKDFSTTFLKGKQDFNFSTTETSFDVMHVEDGKINVMASELYDRTGDLLYDPSLMFDSIHVFWLIEMITEICNRFENAFRDAETERDCVIILDNSPGYIGLGHAVHQLLLRYGPERGKMLSVSSLDIQDLESSVLSAKVLNDMLEDNIDGANCLIKARNNESFTFKSQHSKAFFNELITHERDEDYTFYQKDIASIPIDYYQALIINRVSSAIMTNKVSVNYDDRFKDNATKEIWKALCSDNPNTWMVPSDVNLQKQFYEMTLNDQRTLKKSDADKLRRELKTINIYLERINLSSSRRTDFFTNYRNIMLVDKAMERLKQKMEESIFETIASKMNPAWKPSFPLRELFDSLRDSSFLSESAEMIVPSKEKYSSEYFLKHYGIDSYGISSDADSIMISAINQVNYIMACYLLNPTLAKDGEISLHHLLEQETEWINRSLVKRNSRQSIPSALIMSAMENANGESGWTNIKSSFLTACSRMMDFASDIVSICQVISVITVDNSDNKYSEDVDYASLLDRKVMKKELSLEETLDCMQGALAESDYMRAFRSVLIKVIERWGLLA